MKSFICTVLALLLLTACSENLTPEQRLERARAALEAGDGRTAIIQLKNALQEKPDFIEARVLHGRLQMLSGDPASAEIEFSKAIAAGDDSSETQLLMLNAYLEQEKYEQVVREFPDPESASADALAFLAQAQFHLGHPGQARSTLQLAAARDQESVEVQLALAKLEYRTGNQAKALAYSESALQLDPESVRARLVAGDLALLTGRHDDALKQYKAALDGAPDSTLGLLGATRTCVYLQDTACTGEYLKRLKKRLPKHPETRLMEAWLGYLKGDTSGAIDSARAALSMNPKHAGSQLLLSRLLYSEGAYDQAGELIDSFLKKEPDSIVARKLAAAIRLRQANPDAAIETFAPIPEEARDRDALMLLASAYGSKGERDKSRDLVEQASRLAPDDTDLQIQLALERFAAGQQEQALNHLERLAAESDALTEADASLVLLAVQAGETSRALAVAERISRNTPDSPVPANMRGIIHIGAGETEAAITAFREALELDPEHLPALYNLGRAGLMTGDIALTEEAVERIDAISPNDLSAGVMRATAQLRRGDSRAAIDGLEALRDSHPDAPSPMVLLAGLRLRSGETSEADVLVTQAERVAANDPRVRFLRARLLTANGNLGAASDILKQLLKDNAADAAAARLLAEVQNASGQAAQARETLAAALDVSPEEPGLRFVDAQFKLADGQVAAARGAARAIVDDYPTAPEGLTLLGDIAAAEGNWAESIKHFQAAFDNSPTGLLAMKLHHAMVQAGNGRAADGLVDKWLKANPEDVTALLVQAMQMEREGNLEGAMQAYESILAISPNNALVLNNLAWLLREKNPSRALKLAESAQRLAPDNADVADTYGWLLVGSGQAQQGLRIIRQAADAAPDKPGIRYHLAVAMAESGQRAEAEVELRRLLRDHPDFPEREQAQAYYDGL